MSRRRERSLRRAVTVAVLVGFAAAVTLNAWVCDDAFITLRSVRNVILGRGPIYNPGERVQAFTHPLWMMVLTVVYAVTREAFWTTLVTAALTSVAAAAVILGGLLRGRAWTAIALAGLVMVNSRAYVEYATSGLENPLTHLLLGLAAWRWLGGLPGARQVRGLTLLAALGALCRLDAILLFAPLVVAAVLRGRGRGVGRRALARALLVGSAPLVAWELFSLVYYGALVPNTALAKLGGAVPLLERWGQGLRYLQVSAAFDPVAAGAIVAALAVGALRRRGRVGPLAIAIALHLVYVVWIGGDFMAGRFLTAPLCLAIVVLAISLPPRPPRRVVALSMVAVLGLAAAGERHPLRTRAGDYWRPGDPRARHGVVDERSFYAEGSSLLAYWARPRSMPDHPWRARAEKGTARRAEVFGTLGIYGYFVGPDVYIIDRYGLTDPVLARLPEIRTLRRKPGHIARAVPDGYRLSREVGENRLRDPEVAALFDAVQVVHSGPLLAGRRWIEIVRLATGYYRRRVPFERYHHDGLVKTRFQARATVAPRTLEFKAPGIRIAGPAGEAQRAASITLELSGDQRYRLRYLRGGVERATATIEPAEGARTLRPFTVETPAAARESGFDALHVLPETLTGRRRVELGRVTLE